GPVRLVVAIEVVAEARPAGVEYHRDGVGVGLVDQLVDHVGEAEHGIDRRAVLARQRRQGVKGPEDVAGAVDQVEPMRPAGVVHRRTSWLGWVVAPPESGPTTGKRQARTRVVS